MTTSHKIYYIYPYFFDKLLSYQMNPFLYLNPHDYNQVRIENSYPGLFSESQTLFHKKLTLDYYDSLQKEIINHSGLSSPLPRNLPLLMHLIRSPPHVEPCQLWYHCTFWNAISNTPKPIGPETQKQIKKDYGSVEDFKACLIGTSLGHLGQGWYVWGFHRHYAPATRCMTFSNQITPMRHNIYPLLVINLWDHAFLKDYDTRQSYLKNLWEKLDWEEIESRLVNCKEYMKTMGTNWL